MADFTDNRQAHRYELATDGGTAEASYTIDGDTITFTHTIVPPHLQGKGIATRLIEAALADAKNRKLKVVPLCGFVAAYLRRHPEAT
jgi:uncharacterized protein